MSTKEKLLALWKFFMSFRKHDWEPGDYPVIVREQPIENGSGPVSFHKVFSRVVWREALIGG